MSGGVERRRDFSAAFLDRDGTLIRDEGYLSDPGGVELLPGAAGAVRALNRRDVPVAVVTNQSGIGRGLISEEEHRAVRAEVRRRLGAEGARVDLWLHCPHAPAAGCGCRKPRTGMHRRAARELGVDPGRGLFVGDRVSDVQPAARAGGTGVLLHRGESPPPEVPAGCRIAADLRRAVEIRPRASGAEGREAGAGDAGRPGPGEPVDAEPGGGREGR